MVWVVVVTTLNIEQRTAKLDSLEKLGPQNHSNIFWVGMPPDCLMPTVQVCTVQTYSLDRRHHVHSKYTIVSTIVKTESYMNLPCPLRSYLIHREK